MAEAEISDQFPNLAQLLWAYLNQDYSYYGPELEDAVFAFIEDSDAARIDATRTEIDTFLQIKDNDIETALDCLGHEDHAREPGMGAREYLLWIDGLLAQGEAKQAGF
jgi:hypothetical protein